MQAVLPSKHCSPPRTRRISGSWDRITTGNICKLTFSFLIFLDQKPGIRVLLIPLLYRIISMKLFLFKLLSAPPTPTPTPSLLFLATKGAFKGFVNYKSARHFGDGSGAPEPLRCTHRVSAGRVRGREAQAAVGGGDTVSASPRTAQPGGARALGIREGGGRGRGRGAA